MKLTLRKLRLRAVWLLVVPFLWLARPTAELLAVGAALAAVGVVIRGWAAGVIHKEKELSTGGPYAHTRNPLYLGSLLIGTGVTVAGGRWIFVVLFLVFYAWIYGRSIRSESEILEELFGEPYRHYAENVPLVLPRLTRYRPLDGDATGPAFTVARYRRNREYEALLGVVAGFGFLFAKWMWM